MEGINYSAYIKAHGATNTRRCCCQHARERMSSHMCPYSWKKFVTRDCLFGKLTVFQKNLNRRITASSTEGLQDPNTVWCSLPSHPATRETECQAHKAGFSEFAIKWKLSGKTELREVKKKKNSKYHIIKQPLILKETVKRLQPAEFKEAKLNV